MSTAQIQIKTFTRRMIAAVADAMPPHSTTRLVMAYCNSAGRIVLYDGNRVYHVRAEYQPMISQIMMMLCAAATGLANRRKASVVINPRTLRSIVVPETEGYQIVCAQQSPAA